MLISYIVATCAVTKGVAVGAALAFAALRFDGRRRETLR